MSAPIFINLSPRETECADESESLASELIREAVAATLGIWGAPPPQGVVTFVDASKVRHKRDPGRCYRKAGFRHVGFTGRGLFVFQLQPRDMPAPRNLPGSQVQMSFAG